MEAFKTIDPTRIKPIFSCLACIISKYDEKPENHDSKQQSNKLNRGPAKQVWAYLHARFLYASQR